MVKSSDLIQEEQRLMAQYFPGKNPDQVIGMGRRYLEKIEKRPRDSTVVCEAPPLDSVMFAIEMFRTYGGQRGGYKVA